MLYKVTINVPKNKFNLLEIKICHYRLIFSSALFVNNSNWLAAITVTHCEKQLCKVGALLFCL